MSDKMQQHAVDCASYAFKEKRILDDIAQILKTEFDTMYNPTWHCIVGKFDLICNCVSYSMF